MQFSSGEWLGLRGFGKHCSLNRQARKEWSKEGRLGAGKGFVAHCNAAPGKEFVTWIRLVAHCSLQRHMDQFGVSPKRNPSLAASPNLCIYASLSLLHWQNEILFSRAATTRNRSELKNLGLFLQMMWFSYVFIVWLGFGRLVEGCVCMQAEQGGDRADRNIAKLFPPALPIAVTTGIVTKVSASSVHWGRCEGGHHWPYHLIL